MSLYSIAGSDTADGRNVPPALVIIILLMVHLLELLPVELVVLLSPQRVMLNTQVLVPATVFSGDISGNLTGNADTATQAALP